MTSQERIQEINELKARHLLEVACVPLDALTFPFSGNLNNGNIERLRKAFGGNRCFNEKEEYQIPAIISRDDFDKGTITKREGKRSWFDPAPGVKLQCLRGLHRVRAAEMLYHPPERWLVAIYDSGKSLMCAVLSQLGLTVQTILVTRHPETWKRNTISPRYHQMVIFIIGFDITRADTEKGATSRWQDGGMPV